jgi:hypothetical protein
MAAVCNACGLFFLRFLALCILSEVQTRHPSRMSERNEQAFSPLLFNVFLVTSRSLGPPMTLSLCMRWLFLGDREQGKWVARPGDQSNQLICSLE